MFVEGSIFFQESGSQYTVKRLKNNKKMGGKRCEPCDLFITKIKEIVSIWSTMEGWIQF